MRAKSLGVAMTLAVLCLACADGGPTDAPPPSPVGSYQLVRYDGASLPAVVGEDPANPDRVLAGSLVLNTDGSCSQSRTLLRTRDGVTTTEVDVVGCTYTFPISDRLVIEYEDGRSYRMITWMGDQIAISDFFAPEEVIYRHLP